MRRALPKQLFFALLVRPLVFLLLGVAVHRKDRLPRRGPAIVVANHNSHLDALLLMSLFPLAQLPSVRPLAARDYFFRSRLGSFFARHCLGAIPVERNTHGRTDPLAGAREALRRGEVVVLFPEGTRGEPGQLAPLRPGVAHLAKAFPEVPVVPCHLKGLERALPRGEALLVPFICDATVGEPLRWGGSREGLMTGLESAMASLQSGMGGHSMNGQCTSGVQEQAKTLPASDGQADKNQSLTAD